MTKLDLAWMTLLAAAATAAPAWAHAPAPRAWLDRAPAGWNAPGGAVPRAPKLDAGTDNTRAPQDGPERAVAAKGWLIIGPATHAGRLTVVRATASGGDLHFMESYQLFAFWDGRFAGTLAPAPMTSQTDGAAGGVFDVKGATFKAAFARYTAADPLCCPSRASHVTYRVATTQAGPVVTPVEVETRATH